MKDQGRPLPGRAADAEPVRIVGQQECPISGDVTIFLSDGRAFKIDRHDRKLNLLDDWLEMMGVSNPAGRVDVFQDGRKVGELPEFWQPFLAKSKSFLYDYRPGDLTWRDGAWHAHRSLGGGDLDCLAGFVRKDAPTPSTDHTRDE